MTAHPSTLWSKPALIEALDEARIDCALADQRAARATSEARYWRRQAERRMSPTESIDGSDPRLRDLRSVIHILANAMRDHHA